MNRLCLAATLLLAGCDDGVLTVNRPGGSDYARVSRSANNPCRITVTDMGRASPPVQAFTAIAEDCKDGR